MWKEELDRIIKDDKLHDISYQLKDGRIIFYYVRGIRYSDLYGPNFIDVYCYSPDLANSSWTWRTFKIIRIQAIDGIHYEDTNEYINYQNKLAHERNIKDNSDIYRQPKTNSHEAGCAVSGVLGMAGFILGGIILSTPGCIIGIILGTVVGFLIGSVIDDK